MSKTTSLEDMMDMIGGITTTKDLEIPGVIKTGLRGFDMKVCGVGGLPRGRFSEIYAKESVGKTSVCLHLAGLITQAGGLVGWLESEGTLTGEYAESCGVKSENFHVLRDFTTGEDALNKIKRMLATNMYDLIILDSMPKLVPERIAEAKGTKSTMHDKQQPASMFASFFNSLGGFYVRDTNKKLMKSNKIYEVDGVKVNTFHKLSSKKTHLMFINHAMDDIAALAPGAVTTPGGKKKQFEATLRLWLKAKGTEKNPDGTLKLRKIGIVAQKNKLAPPFGYTTLLLYADGRLEAEDDDSILVDIGKGRGLITQKGGWYYLKVTEGKDSIRLQGSDAVVEYIKKDDEFRGRILAHE